MACSFILVYGVKVILQLVESFAGKIYDVHIDGFVFLTLRSIYIKSTFSYFILKSGPQVHVDLNLLYVLPFTDVRYQFFALFLNPNVVLSRSRFAFL